MGSGRGLDELARELAAGRISRRSALGRLAGAAAGVAVASIPGAEALASASSRCPKSRRCDGKCCPQHAHCKHGKCKCDSGYTKCGKKCFDLQTNPGHCGDCDAICAENEVCSAGECAGTTSTMVPSNIPSDSGLTCESSTTADMTVSSPQTFNTDVACTATFPQDGATDLCVLFLRNLTISTGATLAVTGSRPLAILATGNVTLDGTIDAAAAGVAAGPGGAPSGGVPVSANGTNGAAPASNGGGGGGHGTVGGAGGTGSPPGAAGGIAFGTATLTPLVGGGHGGHNADTSPNAGGGGGGGFQLSACQALSVGSSGRIDAGGGGGQGGQGHPSAAAGGGAGGGAGGSVLLESPQVTVTAGAIIAANGGGAGGGGDTGGSPVAGSPGQDAPLSAGPAAGGPGGGGSAGAGGNGGAGMTAPGQGSAGSGSDGSGGGGGAVGVIRFNTGDGQAPNTSGVVISPAATTGAIATA